MIKINTYVSRKTFLYVCLVGLVLSLGLYDELNIRQYPDDPSVSMVESSFEGVGDLVNKPVYTSWNSEAASTMTIEKREADVRIPAIAAPTVPTSSESIDEPVTEPVKPTSAVMSKSELTKDHIAHIFKGSALAGQALEDPILEIEEKYGINAYFTIAIMKLESGHGKSRLAKEKNNLFGLNAIDGYEHEMAMRFRTKGDCVLEFGDIISRIYLEKGLTTVERVAKKYCPANPKWPTLVKNIMNRDYQKSVM